MNATQNITRQQLLIDALIWTILFSIMCLVAVKSWEHVSTLIYIYHGDVPLFQVVAAVVANHPIAIYLWILSTVGLVGAFVLLACKGELTREAYIKFHVIVAVPALLGAAIIVATSIVINS